MIVFPASNKANYVTGQTFVVDGGGDRTPTLGGRPIATKDVNAQSDEKDR